MIGVAELSEEPKGIYNDDRELLERQEWKRTKRGIVIFKGKGDRWFLAFPDDTERIDANTIEVMNLIYHLEKTNGNLDKSRRLVGWG